MSGAGGILPLNKGGPARELDAGTVATQEVAMAILPHPAPAETQEHFPIFHERCRDAHSWLAGRLKDLDPQTVTDGQTHALKIAVRAYARGACESLALKPITDMLEAELLQTLDDWTHSLTRLTYQDYLKSDGWERTRRKVLARARHICEGCGEARATQVHHLNYEDPRCEELLFNLVALCGRCHDATTARQKRGGNG